MKEKISNSISLPEMSDKDILAISNIATILIDASLQHKDPLLKPNVKRDSAVHYLKDIIDLMAPKEVANKDASNINNIRESWSLDEFDAIKQPRSPNLVPDCLAGDPANIKIDFQYYRASGEKRRGPMMSYFRFEITNKNDQPPLAVSIIFDSEDNTFTHAFVEVNGQEAIRKEEWQSNVDILLATTFLYDHPELTTSAIEVVQNAYAWV